MDSVCGCGIQSQSTLRRFYFLGCKRFSDKWLICFPVKKKIRMTLFASLLMFNILNKVIRVRYMKSFLAVTVSDAFKIFLFLILLFFDCFSRCLYFDLEKAFRGIFDLSACTITQYILTQVIVPIIRLFDPFNFR